MNNIQYLLPEIVGSSKAVYTDILGDGKAKSAFTRFFKGSTSGKVEGFQSILQSSTVSPLRPLINRLRLDKSEAEINNMRKAGKLSGRVITEAMRTNFRSEKELWAYLDFGFKMHGLNGPAYIPVVAGGQVCGITGEDLARR